MNAAATAQRRNAGAKGRKKRLVGRDFARRAASAQRWRGPGAAVVLGLVLGGLLLASLRMEIVRTRYALADALAQETALVGLELAAGVELRELRDPRRLRRLANELRFVRPGRVIDLGTDFADLRGDFADLRGDDFAAPRSDEVVAP